MRTPHGHAVAYNAQTAVDAEHKLIVAFELTNEGNDLQQLHPMAVQGKAAVGVDQVTAVADTGYSNGEHGALCERDGFTRIVPQRDGQPARQAILQPRQVYLRARQRQLALSGRRTLSLYKTSHTQKKKEYTTKACGGCPLKPQCTNTKRRVLVRDYAHGERGDAPAGNRRSGVDEATTGTAEHPFGTTKGLMAYPRFLRADR